MARKSWKNLTPYDAKRSPRNLSSRHRVSGVRQRESNATGIDVEQQWAKRRGDVAPIVTGESLRALDAMLAQVERDARGIA